MSKKNPFTVSGNKGRVSFKRFPKGSKALTIKQIKAVPRVPAAKA
jgi:hypothetical protein